MKRIFTILCALALVMAGSATALAAEPEAGQSASYYPVSVDEYTYGDFDELRINKTILHYNFQCPKRNFFLEVFQKFCFPRANKETGYIHNRASRTILAPLVSVLVCVCNRLYLYQSDQPIQLALPYESVVGYHMGK